MYFVFVLCVIVVPINFVRLSLLLLIRKINNDGKVWSDGGLGLLHFVAVCRLDVGSDLSIMILY